jgi:hypothetical protein
MLREQMRCIICCDMDVQELWPVDPYFWFPRLWEAARSNGYAVNIARELVQELCATGKKELTDICLALCAIIEKKQKEKGKDA